MDLFFQNGAQNYYLNVPRGIPKNSNTFYPHSLPWKKVVLYDHGKHGKVKKKDFMGILGPEWAITRFFSNCYYTLQSSLFIDTEELWKDYI